MEPIALREGLQGRFEALHQWQQGTPSFFRHLACLQSIFRSDSLHPQDLHQRGAACLPGETVDERIRAASGPQDDLNLLNCASDRWGVRPPGVAPLVSALAFIGMQMTDPGSDGMASRVRLEQGTNRGTSGWSDLLTPGLPACQ